MIFNNTRNCNLQQINDRRLLFNSLKEFYETELTLLSSCLSSKTFTSRHYTRGIRCCSVLLISMGDVSYDETIAESLWNNLKEQINQKLDASKTILVFPLLISCIEVLTKLAIDFAFLGSCVLATLRDFLIEPAPLMANLHDKIFIENDLRDVYYRLYSFVISRLTMVMKAGSQEDVVHVFLSTLSRRLFAVKSTTGPQISVANNAVHICSEIAISYKSVPKIVNSVFQILSQNFTNTNITLDGTILSDMMRVITSGCTIIYDQTINFLSSIVAESESLERIDMINRAFIIMVENVGDWERQVNVLLGLLQIYVKWGTRLITPKCQNSILTHKLNSLLPILAKLMDGMEDINNCSSTLFFLFCDFWIISSNLNYHSSTVEEQVSSSMSTIACHSPALTSPKYILKERYGIATRSVLIQLNSDVMMYRNKLLGLMENCDSNVVNRLDVAQSSYLTAIFVLENLRTLNSPHVLKSVSLIYKYLEDKHFVKDKLGIHQCIKTLATLMFRNCLNSLIGGVREAEAVQIAKFLLVKFNSDEKFICGLADSHLSDLVNRIPQVLWSKDLLATLLDIFQILTNSDEHCLSSSLPLEGTQYQIDLKETLAERREAAQIFQSRCSEILKEASKFSPGRARSNLIQYLIEKSSSYGNSTITMVIHSLLSDEATRPPSSPVHATDDPYFSFVSIMQRRVAYFNEVKVLVEINSRDEIFDSLHKEFERAVQYGSFELFEASLHKTSALLILNNDGHPINKRLVNFVAFAHLSFFSARTVMCAVACWEWILAIKSDQFELELIINIAKAFVDSSRKRLGFFNIDVSDSRNDPLTVRVDDLVDFSTMRSLMAHEPWLIFLHEKVENKKYSSPTYSDIFVNMMCLCLTQHENKSNLFAATNIVFGLVAKFFSIGFSLCQSSTWRKNVSILRNRLYYSVVRFFSCNLMFPSHSGAVLKRDIVYMNSLWSLIHRDKKFFQDSSSMSDIDCGTSLVLSAQTKDDEKFSMKRRSLLLVVLAIEIERFTVWYNPMDVAEMGETEDKLISSWRASHIKDKYLVEYCLVAWNIYPPSAVFFAIRIRTCELVNNEVRRLVTANPSAVMHVPEALFFFVSFNMAESDSPLLNYVSAWALCSPVVALSFFSRNFPAHSTLQKYAIRVLESCSVDVTLRYILQIVQCLKNDKLGLMQSYILSASSHSQLLAHQFLWNLKSNLSEGVPDGNVLDRTINKLTEDIISSMTGEAEQLYNTEFKFIDDIINVSGIIRDFPKGESRNAACVDALSRIPLVENCYLPSNPECIIVGIDAKSAVSLQSAEKAPYLVKFKVQQMRLDEVEMFCQGKIPRPPGQEYWLGAIMKVGDDVRQDALALQFMELFNIICKSIQLNVYFRPYRVVSTSPSSGIIECVPSCMSRSKIGDETDTSLFDYFKSRYGGDKSQTFFEARRCFIESMAAYSVFCYLLQIKDRHNGNIMISDCGHIIHIDFGFLFETSPGGNLGWEPDFKLTEEMLQIMGGRVDSPHFQYFTELCVKAFLAVRQHTDSIITLVSLMTDSGFPCFRGNSVKLLSSRLNSNLSCRGAAQHMRKIISNCCLSIRSLSYDAVQYFQNKIPY